MGRLGAASLLGNIRAGHGAYWRQPLLRRHLRSAAPTKMAPASPEGSGLSAAGGAALGHFKLPAIQNEVMVWRLGWAGLGCHIIANPNV